MVGRRKVLFFLSSLLNKFNFFPIFPRFTSRNRPVVEKVWPLLNRLVAEQMPQTLAELTAAAQKAWADIVHFNEGLDRKQGEIMGALDRRWKGPGHWRRPPTGSARRFLSPRRRARDPPSFCPRNMTSMTSSPTLRTASTRRGGPG